MALQNKVQQKNTITCLSQAAVCPPFEKTGAQLTLDTAVSQKQFQNQEPGLLRRMPRRSNQGTSSAAYLPDLMVVQVRVRMRWVAAGRSAMAYSLACTSAGG